MQFLIDLFIYHSSSFQAVGKITSEGVFLEKLETDPSKYLPEITTESLGGEVVQVMK